MRLRILEPADADGMISWMHNPELTRYLATNFSEFTKEKALAFITDAADETKSVHRACVDDNDRYLGTVSLKHIDREAKNAEYAICFCQEAQGTGAARFATDGILRYGFETLGLERVYLYLISENLRADHFYQKYGFIYEGTFVKHQLLRGELKDVKWYRMLREEWLAKQKNG